MRNRLPFIETATTDIAVGDEPYAKGNIIRMPDGHCWFIEETKNISEQQFEFKFTRYGNYTLAKKRQEAEESLNEK